MYILYTYLYYRYNEPAVRKMLSISTFLDLRFKHETFTEDEVMTIKTDIEELLPMLVNKVLALDFYKFIRSSFSIL